MSLSSRGFMCDRMFWCAGGNPNQPGLREWISKIKWCGSRTFISDGPGRDRIIHHGALVSCSQVPCVVKLKWFWHGADAGSCSDDEPRPVFCMEDRYKSRREEPKVLTMLREEIEPEFDTEYSVRHFMPFTNSRPPAPHPLHSCLYSASTLFTLFQFF